MPTFNSFRFRFFPTASSQPSSNVLRVWLHSGQSRNVVWWRTKHERSEWQHFRQGLSSREATSIKAWHHSVVWKFIQKVSHLILVEFIETPNDETDTTPILLPQENPIVWEDYGTGGIIIGGPYMPRWICTPKCSVGGHHDMELTEVDPYRCSAEQVAGSLDCHANCFCLPVMFQLARNFTVSTESVLLTCSI